MLRLVSERQVEREDAGLAEQFGRGELAHAGSGEGRDHDDHGGNGGYDDGVDPGDGRGDKPSQSTKPRRQQNW